MRITRTLRRVRKNVSFGTHVLYTKCIRDTFGSRMSTRYTNILAQNVCVRKIQFFIHTLCTHTHHTFYTHINTKLQNVFVKSPSTFCHSRVLSGARDTNHTKAIYG